MFFRVNLMGFCLLLVGGIISLGVENFSHSHRSAIFICGCFLFFTDALIRLLSHADEGLKALIKSDCGGTCTFLPVWLAGLLSAIIAIANQTL